MNTLRVGICECSGNIYRGTMKNKKVVVTKEQENSNLIEIPFIIKEVLVPEGNHNPKLLRSRCHMFIDVNRYNYNWMKEEEFETGVRLIDYVQSSYGPKETIPFSGWGLSESWRMNTPCDIETVLAGIKTILESLDTDDLFAWLIHISPRRWSFDPRPQWLKTEKLKVFWERVKTSRERRLDVYHCYPACTSDCRAGTPNRR